jgi:DNA-binding response OmpR family regulator
MKNKRLLLVDDQPDLDEVVQFVGTELGYEVRITSRGKDFMRVFESFKPTTVMLDMVMPDIDGFELIAWLYDHDCDAKILVFSASNAKYATMAKTLGQARGLNVSIVEKPSEVAALSNALTCHRQNRYQSAEA